MSAMRVFDQLGIRREIEAIGSPLTLFGRSEDNGKRIASLNFESLRTYQDRPTLGVNHLELERKLQELVSLKSDIQPQCIIESIESPLSTNPVQAQVKWQSNFLSTRTPSKGFYDAVVISEGPFSPTRERMWPQQFDLHGMVNVLETVIPRPPNVMKGYCSDQWGLDRRVGFFPVDHPNKDLLYVYAHSRADTASLEPEQKRVPAMKLVELFQDFTGSWKDIAETIGTLSNINSTILLSGGFIKDVQPLHNRVLALGDSAAVLTTPCFGHEIGIATESASFLGNVLAINNAPVLAGLLTYGERFSSLQPIIDAAKNDVHGSTLMNPNIPKWIAKFIVRRSFSDSALVNQEIDYNNLQSSKQEELDAAPMLRIGTLREEWYKMDEVTRQRSKEELKAERDAAQTQVDEHLSTMLAIEHKKQQEKKPSDL
jgi:2-polyprenyl-6-methoxyphenol hydroxylase-like FAD-dependent oxidoreductase